MPERIHTITEIRNCLLEGDHFAIILISPKVMYRVRSKEALAELHSFALSEGHELSVIAGKDYLDIFYVFSLVMIHTESKRLLHEIGTLFCPNVTEGRKVLEELYYQDDPLWSIPEIKFFKI